MILYSRQSIVCVADFVQSCTKSVTLIMNRGEAEDLTTYISRVVPLVTHPFEL
jgi:hypothetical protein